MVLHLSGDKPGGITGERNRLLNPGFQGRKRKPQTSDYKILWGLWQWEETSSLTAEFIEETHRVPELYTNPPTQESAPEGLHLLVGSRGSD